MKTTLSLLTALVFTAFTTSAQTCDHHVAAGRAHLVNADYPSAKTSFASAVLLCPDHEEANALLAAVRFPAWLETPAGSNWLTRLDFPTSGRVLTNWTAVPMADIQGVPLAPAGVSAQELGDVLRTNLLGEVQASLENLERITNTGFLLNLASNETRMADVMVDYGDVLMLRAMLHAAEYGSYTANSYNNNALLSVLREVAVDGPSSLETLFDDYPELLTYTTTNDLQFAREAFVNSCELYQEASALIRARDPLAVRLFNNDEGRAASEADFRRTLDDLKVALTNAVVLWDNTNYTVHLQPFFAGQIVPRAFLPDFVANRYVRGTLPDLNLGGMVSGFNEETAEGLLSELLDSIPRIGNGNLSGDGTFRAMIRLDPDTTYEVYGSTNFLDWELLDQFYTTSNTYVLEDPAAGAHGKRFYGVVSPWDPLIPWPDNDWIYSAPWLNGSNFVASANTTSASKEYNEPDHDGNPGGASVWWMWTAPASGTVTVSTEGSNFDTILAIYTGYMNWDLATLQYVASDDDSGGNLTSRIGFKASAGVTYQIAVDGYFGDVGTVQLGLSMP